MGANLLDKKALEEFVEVFKKKFPHVEISEQKASDLGISLLNIYRVIYRPLKKGGELRCEINRASISEGAE